MFEMKGHPSISVKDVAGLYKINLNPGDAENIKLMSDTPEKRSHTNKIAPKWNHMEDSIIIQMRF